MAIVKKYDGELLPLRKVFGMENGDSENYTTIRTVNCRDYFSLYARTRALRGYREK